MRKNYLLKCFGIASAMLLSVGVFGQAIPTVTTTTVTDVANYVELKAATGAGLNWSGAATPIGGYTNLFTVSGTPNLLEYTRGAATPALAYINHPATAIVHKIPIVVVPDQDVNPGSFVWNGVGNDLDYTQLSNLTSWNWSLAAATTALLENTTTALPATFIAGGGALRSADHFNQRYLNTGTTVEAFQLKVDESNINPGGTAALCADADESMLIKIVSFPSAVLNASGAAQDCWNLDGTKYNLVVDLVGTPPFYIGLDYEIVDYATAPVTTNEYIEILTGATAGAADLNDGRGPGGAGANFIFGALSDAGDADPFTWRYTITLEQDPNTNGVAAGSNEINLITTNVTKHTLTVMYVNDLISRMSDRNGTVGTPSAVAELNNHVLYTTPAIAMAVKLLPLPKTGNVFTFKGL